MKYGTYYKTNINGKNWYGGELTKDGLPRIEGSLTFGKWYHKQYQAIAHVRASEEREKQKE